MQQIDINAYARSCTFTSTHTAMYITCTFMHIHTACRFKCIHGNPDTRTCIHKQAHCLPLTSQCTHIASTLHANGSTLISVYCSWLMLQSPQGVRGMGEEETKWMKRRIGSSLAMAEIEEEDRRGRKRRRISRSTNDPSMVASSSLDRSSFEVRFPWIDVRTAIARRTNKKNRNMTP